ncbi:hypothetical protein C8J57DRAFT_999582, partial [Mycena rebaudengoi]
MNYENYLKAVVLGYKVKLVGWPEVIPFKNLTNIHTVNIMQILYNTLEDGSCHWVKLSNAELVKSRETYYAKVEAGEIEPRKRKERADKGQKR